MKLLSISIISLMCLSMVLADKTDKISSDNDELDIVLLAKDDTDTKSSESLRKRDSGYSYKIPDRLSSSRYESSGIRGRIVTKYSSSQTVRPFNRYGPPKQTNLQFAKPSNQYAPQYSQAGAHRQHQQQHRRPHPQQSGFSNQENKFGSGQMQQEVPSSIRNYDFVEPSPIASQNNEPFKSNAANYLPPRNQKLPGYSNPNQFSNHHQSTQIPENQQIRTTNFHHHNQQQNFNTQHQSQPLVQNQFQDQQEISEAAQFLTQNAQAISQLYESPATNLNYEPFHESQRPTDLTQNPNNQFQTFNVKKPSHQGLENSRGFQGSLPSYASGFLDSQQTLEQVQSLEKDRLIAQLQLALAQGNPDSSASTSARYAQNHPIGSYIQSQSFLTSLGTQINPSIGPQLDKPNGFNGQNSFAGGNTGFGHQATFLPNTGTTASGLPITYGVPSTIPVTQSPSPTTVATSTTTSATSHRPPQGTTSDGNSQVGNSVPPLGTSLTFPFPQYGSFVPTLVGTNYVTNYPTYGNNFLGSNSQPITPVQSSESSPTQFGIPIPTIPTNTHGTSASFSPPSSMKPLAPPSQHHHPSTTIHTIPAQPIQPIHPIAATPINPIFPVAPTVTQVHPIQNPVASNHPTYGLQPAAINPLLIKPVKGIYPIYYYPNLYQVQKPAVSTLPWNYAPSYTQTKPQQIWK